MFYMSVNVRRKCSAYLQRISFVFFVSVVNLDRFDINVKNDLFYLFLRNEFNLQVRYSHGMSLTISPSYVSSATFTDYPNSLSWFGSIQGCGYRHFSKGATCRVWTHEIWIWNPLDIMYSGFNRSDMRPSACYIEESRFWEPTRRPLGYTHPCSVIIFGICQLYTH